MTISRLPSLRRDTATPSSKALDIELEDTARLISRRSDKMQDFKEPQHTVSIQRASSSDGLHEQSTPPRKHFLHFGWWYETGSIVLGWLCGAAIIIILAKVDGMAISRWTMPIQTHSLLAIFTTVAKAALVYPLAECLGQLKWEHFERSPQPLAHMQAFDSASRGPWGAALFIWKTKGTAVVAAIGAGVSILMLAFEPFTQQIIQFDARTTLLTNVTGSVTATNAWSDTFLGAGSPLGLLHPELSNLMLAVMKSDDNAAIGGYSGAFCPTTTCQAEEFTSLAICESCSNEEINNSWFDTCLYTISPLARNFTTLEKFRAALNDTAPDETTVHCEKVIPNIARLSLDLTVRNGSTTLEDGSALSFSPSSAGFLQVSAGVQGQLQFCSNLVDAPEPTRAISSACFNSTTPRNQYSNLENLGKITGSVTTCRLDFCARHYRESPIFSPSNISASMGLSRSSPLVLINNSSLKNDLQTIQDAVFEAEDKNGIPGKFNVGQKSRLMLAFQLDNLLSSGPFLEGLYLNSNTSTHGVGNWTYRFQQLAHALSTIVQSPTNPNSTNITAGVYGPQVFVRVEWGWLILPLVTAVFSTVFLAMTVLESSRKSYLLKTSALSSIFCGLEDRVESERQVAGAGGTVTEYHFMDDAKEMRVRLTRNADGGLRLKEE